MTKHPFHSMGLLLRSLAMLLIILLCLDSHSLPCVTVRAQSTTPTATSSSSRSQAMALDAILQDYAYRALVRPKTGTIYNATVLPSNLTGVKVAALRLRSGSLRRRGFSMYNEFQIPTGLVEKPYVKRLVLVYQNLGNWSTTYYPLANYTYLAPVLGLIAYNGSNLTATNLPELDVNATRDPIQVKFGVVKSPPHGAVAKCVWFDLQGSSNFSNVTAGNTCSTLRQGHYSIVAESPPPPVSPAPAPAPAPAPVPSTPSAPPGRKGEEENNSNKKVWIIVGSVLGGLALLVLLLLLVLWVHNFKQKKKMQRMERAAEVGEALHMASVGDTKAPAATVTRTQPTIEHEYAP